MLLPDAVLTGFVERSSNGNLVSRLTCLPLQGADNFAADVLAHPVAKDTQYPMGWTSENVSKGERISSLCSRQSAC